MSGDPRPAIQRLRQRKERHQRRGRIYRIVFGIIGGGILLLGVVLSLPGVPGPGIVLIAIGLGMLALEFERAERLLERILDRVEAAREKASPLQQAIVGGAGLLAVIGFAVAVLFLDVPLLPG